MHFFLICLLIQMILMLISIKTLNLWFLYTHRNRWYNAWVFISLWPFVLHEMIMRQIYKQSYIEQAHTRR